MVNPSTKLEPSTGWTSISEPGNTSDILNKFTVRSYFMNAGDMFIIDELRIGTTYESVIDTYTSTGTVLIIK